MAASAGRLDSAIFLNDRFRLMPREKQDEISAVLLHFASAPPVAAVVVAFEAAAEGRAG